MTVGQVERDAPSAADAGEKRDQTAVAPGVLGSFTILGRWDTPLGEQPRITYGVVAEGELAEATRAAAEAWTATEALAFVPVTEGEEPDVLVSFVEGEHRTRDGRICASLRFESTLAHTGRPAPGSFVHVNRASDWATYSLTACVAHELGHVLGLGHSPTPTSLMYPDPSQRAEGPGVEEKLAVWSLYFRSFTGAPFQDVRVYREREILAVLGGILPLDHDVRVGGGVVDTDRDGDDEVLVWRLDPAGNGALMIYHFDEGPRLARTVGPLPGMVIPDELAYAGVSEDGEPMIVQFLADDRWQARGFDAKGQPALVFPRALRFLPTGATAPWVDADGDGVWDEAGELQPTLGPDWTCDLDGDGVEEHVVWVQEGSWIEEDE